MLKTHFFTPILDWEKSTEWNWVSDWAYLVWNPEEGEPSRKKPCPLWPRLRSCLGTFPKTASPLPTWRSTAGTTTCTWRLTSTPSSTSITRDSKLSRTSKLTAGSKPSGSKTIPSKSSKIWGTDFFLHAKEALEILRLHCCATLWTFGSTLF